MDSIPASQWDLKPEFQEYLNTQISGEETVLWAGATDVEARLKRTKWLVLLSCIPMMALCSLPLINNPGAISIMIFSVVFWGGLGVFIYFGYLNHYRTTIYAVTDRRLLIMNAGRPKKTQSFPPEEIYFLKIKKRKGEKGDLYFSRQTQYVGSDNMRDFTQTIGFLFITNPGIVADLIRKTFHKGL